MMYQTPLYGKWEDFSASKLPELDVCGGHFGSTPGTTAITELQCS
jgi:hypothetical protein